jgi:hypothetical protein
MHHLGVVFLPRVWAQPEGASPSRSPRGGVQGAEMEVATVSLEGPFSTVGPGDTPSRRQIFVCRPSTVQDERPCAKTILTTLARRAYRRSVEERDLETLLRFYDAGRKQNGFESGIRFAIERLLVSLEFLTRIEHVPPTVAPGTPYRLSDLELASRLSFFLWSSIPDDELLDTAVRGKLRDPKELERQVRRMLVSRIRR